MITFSTTLLCARSKIISSLYYIYQDNSLFRGEEEQKSYPDNGKGHSSSGCSGGKVPLDFNYAMSSSSRLMDADSTETSS